MKNNNIKIFAILFIALSCMCSCGKDKKETEEDVKSAITQNSIEFKCNDINNNYVLYFDSNYLILSNNKVYNVLIGDKLFSNKQQCKEIPTENEINIKQVKTLKLGSSSNIQPYIIDDNNETYSIYDNKIESVKDDNYYSRDFINSFLLNNNIEKVISLNAKSYSNNLSLLILKNDGKLYKNEYVAEKSNNSKTKNYQLLTEEILSLTDEYGKIYNFDNCSSNNCGFSTNSYSLTLEENISTKDEYILTSKGLYYYEEIKTKKCVEYEDVDCESNFVKKKDYDTIKYDIKYFDNNLILLKDGKILSVYDLLDDTEK